MDSVVLCETAEEMDAATAAGAEIVAVDSKTIGVRYLSTSLGFRAKTIGVRYLSTSLGFRAKTIGVRYLSRRT
jgi:hypothetical protein